MSSFRDFGLSEATLSGLEECGYKEPTAIQSKAIPLAVEGKDILGAARTGSGKTLAFLIPVLERLDTLKWSSVYGLGALIITPTRELAYQIYEVLRKVGKNHNFSAALIIGGKDLKFETPRLKSINIIIGTPGRVQHHMDQNPEFDCSNVEILVLDEADRILDLGFTQQINAIIENLPATRHTLLFSATQTRSVKQLARLSLKDPVFVSADQDDSPFSMPEKLTQTYIVMNVEEKLNFLWSFIVFHRRSKILVFLASCKQVKFFNDVLCHMRPGISILALHGNQHQLKRMDVYDVFYRKEHAVLLATDVASRGLDFPKIDYVIQLDCPDDAVQYVHRAGRTARYNLNGVAVLIVTPKEEERFVIPQLIEKRKLAIEKMEPNQHHQKPLQLASILARFPDLKDSAQRCFKAYLKSIWMVQHHDDLGIDLDAYAKSLGLYNTPRIRFLQRHQKNQEKSNKKEPISEEASKNLQPDVFLLDNEESDDDVLQPKKHYSDETNLAEEIDEMSTTTAVPLVKVKFVSKSAVAKRMMKKGIVANTRIVFDGSGNPVGANGAILGSVDDTSAGLDVEEAKQLLQIADIEDREVYRKRIREKHRLERKKKKELRRKPGQPLPAGERGEMDDDDKEASFGVTLGGGSDHGMEDDEYPQFPVLNNKKPEEDKKRRTSRVTVNDEELEAALEDPLEDTIKARKLKIKKKSKREQEKKIQESGTGSRIKRLKNDVSVDEKLALELLKGY